MIMAQLPFGCKVTTTHVDGMNYKVNVVIKWYSLPILMWKAAHEEYNIRWYQYPRLIGIVAKHTLFKLVGK